LCSALSTPPLLTRMTFRFLLPFPLDHGLVRPASSEHCGIPFLLLSSLVRDSNIRFVAAWSLRADSRHRLRPSVIFYVSPTFIRDLGVLARNRWTLGGLFLFSGLACCRESAYTLTLSRTLAPCRSPFLHRDALTSGLPVGTFLTPPRKREDSLYCIPLFG